MAKSKKKVEQFDLFSQPKPALKPQPKPAPQKKVEQVVAKQEPKKEASDKILPKTNEVVQGSLMQVAATPKHNQKVHDQSKVRDRSYLGDTSKLGLAAGNFGDYIANIRGNKIKTK